MILGNMKLQLTAKYIFGEMHTCTCLRYIALFFLPKMLTFYGLKSQVKDSLLLD